MVPVHYGSASAARAHLEDLLDAAAQGRVATVSRESGRIALVDAARLRDALAALTRSHARMVLEEGEWAAFLPGLPVHAVGTSVDEVVGELADALREYAEDWHHHLRTAPNHDNWGLVQMTELSTDQQLRDWIVAGSPAISARG